MRLGGKVAVTSAHTGPQPPLPAPFPPGRQPSNACPLVPSHKSLRNMWACITISDMLPKEESRLACAAGAPPTASRPGPGMGSSRASWRSRETLPEAILHLDFLP